MITAHKNLYVSEPIDVCTRLWGRTVFLSVVGLAHAVVPNEDCLGSLGNISNRPELLLPAVDSCGLRHLIRDSHDFSSYGTGGPNQPRPKAGVSEQLSTWSMSKAAASSDDLPQHSKQQLVPNHNLSKTQTLFTLTLRGFLQRRRTLETISVEKPQLWDSSQKVNWFRNASKL